MALFMLNTQDRHPGRSNGGFAGGSEDKQRAYPDFAARSETSCWTCDLLDGLRSVAGLDADNLWSTLLDVQQRA